MSQKWLLHHFAVVKWWEWRAVVCALADDIHPHGGVMYRILHTCGCKQCTSFGVPVNSVHDLACHSGYTMTTRVLLHLFGCSYGSSLVVYKS